MKKGKENISNQKKQNIQKCCDRKIMYYLRGRRNVRQLEQGEHGAEHGAELCKMRIEGQAGNMTFEWV